MSSVLKNQPLTGCITTGYVPSGLPRFVEFVLAAFGLLLLLPVFLLCSIAVWISSPGPIFFRQRRVGRHGRVFTLYKFRTMRVSQTGSLITAANDQRITKIGRFLRQWKVDELPEIYNVLVGEMSLVGPRPEVPELVDLSNPAWTVILSSRPGITDPVTLSLRNEERLLANVQDKEAFYRDVIQPYKLNGYLKYLEVKSIRTDLRIVLRTAKVILIPGSQIRPLETAELTAAE
jgi:lipopolysaccharide/colanic/teichoic acid biosynthesis glycosyltransferase